MSVIDLTGLRAELPIGAMAAFGVLRICSPKLKEARLSWKPGPSGWHAALHAAGELNADDLTTLLIGSLPSAEQWRERGWPEQIKTIQREVFHEAGLRAVASASAVDRSEADWLSAFASELVHDEEGRLDATPFDMSVARQKFLADAVRLAATLGNAERKKKQKTQMQEFGEALFGPWKYEDDQHSLGWDPSTVKLGAFTHKAPTAMANTGVRAAVWLAFESLPLFPVFADGKRQRTRAFIQAGRSTTFCWPVWEPAITLAELACLLGSSEMLRKQEPGRALAPRGVTAIYRSLKFKPNKYMVTFRPAELVYSES